MDIEEPSRCEDCIKSYNDWHNQTPEERLKEQQEREKLFGGNILWSLKEKKIFEMKPMKKWNRLKKIGMYDKELLSHFRHDLRLNRLGLVCRQVDPELRFIFLFPIFIKTSYE